MLMCKTHFTLSVPVVHSSFSTHPALKRLSGAFVANPWPTCWPSFHFPSSLLTEICKMALSIY